MFIYASTLAALTVTPGPLVAILAARASGSDRRGACALVLGVCLGDIFFVVAICIGLGYWLQSHPEILLFIKYVGAAFLFWMAWCMWRPQEMDISQQPPICSRMASILAGFLICLSSVPTIMIYLAILPRVVDLTAVLMQEFAFLILATLLVRPCLFLGIVLLAGGLQQEKRSSAGWAIWGRLTSLTVAVSAGWILFW